MQFNDDEAMFKAGKWLCRRLIEARRRGQAAQDIVDACGVSAEELGREWHNQVASQLVKPARTWHAAYVNCRSVVTD